MAHVDELAAKAETKRAEAFSAEAKQLNDIAKHLKTEAREHTAEAEALRGGRRRSKR